MAEGRDIKNPALCELSVPSTLHDFARIARVSHAEYMMSSAFLLLKVEH